jgi:hypothetical protein
MHMFGYIENTAYIRWHIERYTEIRPGTHRAGRD